MVAWRSEVVGKASAGVKSSERGRDHHFRREVLGGTNGEDVRAATYYITQIELARSTLEVARG